jgi:DNA-binding transcriptional regulator YiaG
MGKQYRDEIAMVCHDMMKGFYESGAITEAEMREFDADCLVPESTANNSSARQPSVPAYTHSHSSSFTKRRRNR